MKNNEIESSRELRLPELQVSPRWKKIIYWAGHIECSYCLFGFLTLLALSLLLMPGYVWENLWIRIKAQKILLTLILIFCAVAVSLVWKTGQSVDVWVFKVFNMRGKRACWVDKTMLGLTQIGSSIFALGVAVVFYLLSDHLLAYEVILGTLTLWLFVEFIKILIQRTRPYVTLKDIRIVGARAGGTSFPSGHTSQSFFMAALLSHYFNFGLLGGAAIYAVALLIGITRIYVGMHYPRDVIGGAVFGTFWGLLGVVINSYLV